MRVGHGGPACKLKLNAGWGTMPDTARWHECAVQAVVELTLSAKQEEGREASAGLRSRRKALGQSTARLMSQTDRQAQAQAQALTIWLLI